MKALGLRFTWQYDGRGIICIVLTDEQNPQIVTSKGVVCSKKDQYIKEHGRRKALKKALLSNRMYAYLNSNSIHGEDAKKQFRAKIWNVYRTMTKKPRW